jgi:hypothetical protein
MYNIILYNSGNRVRVIKGYHLYTNALKKYNNLLKSNNVFFPKQYMSNGIKTDYELVLTAPSKNKTKIFFRNEFGALVKIKPKGDFSIKRVTKYYIEEVFTDRLNGKKVTFKDVIKEIVKNHDLTPVIYVLNNKLYIEYFESELINLYILKNDDDSYRLSEAIKSFTNANDLYNVIFFQEPINSSKYRIYRLLNENYNIPLDYMYKVCTR